MNPVNLIQEPPSSSLTDQALELYLRSKAAITEWEPRPMPAGWRLAPPYVGRHKASNRMESQ